MTIKNVITGVREEVLSVEGCENTNISALKDFEVRKTCRLGMESELVNVLCSAGTGKRSRVVEREEAYEGKAAKHIRLDGFDTFRVRRNVKWATKLEEHWDGLEKRQPCLFKQNRAGLKSILKKEPAGCFSPVSMCLHASSSDTSYTSDEDDQHALEEPRRLKFKLRYGCRNADAQSCIRRPLITL